jgi:hypothetical protein
MILGEDYRFHDELSEKYDTVPIELLIDPYKGVILRFTKVAIKEVGDGTAKLNFGYDLIELGENHTETSLRNDKKFENFAGLILNAMILEVAEADANKSGKDDTQVVTEE